MQYLYETHFHTSEASRCANLSAQRGVRALQSAGYSGVCVTDHFHSEWLAEWGGMPYKQKIRTWLRGYENAKQLEGERFRVFLGMELRLPDSNNEFLLYGLTRELVLHTPGLADFTPEKLKAFADQNGLFVAQAHPFRRLMSPCPPAVLHGMEVYNASVHHNSRNHLAREYALKHGLTGIAGSDSHTLEDVGRGGIRLDSPCGSSPALAKRLVCGRQPKLMISD